MRHEIKFHIASDKHDNIVMALFNNKLSDFRFDWCVVCIITHCILILVIRSHQELTRVGTLTKREGIKLCSTRNRNVVGYVEHRYLS